jgi:aspartyl-tRNA(Asn)/glutamyl-tRNA(Gln) amidotransferase subunit A
VTHDPHRLSLEEQSALLAKRALSSAELVEHHLERCERLNPKLNAFITLDAAGARAAARSADGELASGRCRGRLHGIPIAHKDLFDTGGVRTTYGSKFFRDHTPTRDAEVVRRLKTNGAVSLGKLNLHEFAAGSTSNNPWYGPARNPWDTARSAGGSSGGSGSAVAARLCAGTTGTDTGGSIRNPAACNGVVGLKPTNGRVSLAGCYPLCASLDTAGPLARTVRDAAILLQAMAGFDPGDPTSVNASVPDYLASVEDGVGGLRLAFCPDLYFSEIDSAVLAALESAGRVLETLGARLSTVRFPDASTMTETCLALFRGETGALHRARFQAAPGDFGPDVAQLLRERCNLPCDEYVRAVENRLLLRRRFESMMADADALLLPTAPCPAPLIDGRCQVNGKDADFGAIGLPMRMPVNVFGIPSLALPMGYLGTLPISMQVIGPAWSEALILRIGRAFERATPELRDRAPALA